MAPGAGGHGQDRRRPRDTSAEAQHVQDRRYGELDAAGRVAIVFRLNASVRAMTAAGIRLRHPGYTDEEIKLALARLTCGDDLVRRAWPGRPLIDP